MATGRPLRGPAAGGFAQRRGTAWRYRASASAGWNSSADAGDLGHRASISLAIGQCRSRHRAVAGPDEVRCTAPAVNHWATRPRSCCRCALSRNADKPVTLRADINYAVVRASGFPSKPRPSSPSTSVASTEDSALFAALDTVPKPANVGDPNLLDDLVTSNATARERAGRRGRADAREVSLFVEGPTPDGRCWFRN